MTDAKKVRNCCCSAPSPRRSKASAKPPSVDSARRKTGIQVESDMPWGAHLCMFYETKQDLLDTLAGYFHAGLASNEFCVLAVSKPVTVAEAHDYLRRAIPRFDEYFAAGQIEILNGYEFYFKDDRFDLKRITGGWDERLNRALADGWDGVRVSGNAFWLQSKHWKEFYDYERELDQSLAGRKMIVLCTYPFRASRAVDMLDVARAHQYSLVRRRGRWELLETPELKRANQEIGQLNGALDILSNPFIGRKALTRRERAVLVQIARGASSKEAARALAISPRTIEFHRANIMEKLGAKNTVDLVRRVLGKSYDDDPGS